jgi:hypothetical protein
VCHDRGGNCHLSVFLSCISLLYHYNIDCMYCIYTLTVLYCTYMIDDHHPLEGHERRAVMESSAPGRLPLKCRRLPPSTMYSVCVFVCVLNNHVWVRTHLGSGAQPRGHTCASSSVAHLASLLERCHSARRPRHRRAPRRLVA